MRVWNKNKQNHLFESFSPLAALLSIVFSVALWLNFGPAFASLVAKLPINDPIFLAYLVANAPFLIMASGLLVSIKVCMRTNFSALVTDRKKLDWIVVFRSARVYLMVLVLFTVLSALVKPHYFRLNHTSPVSLLVMVPFVLILTPLQTTAEELLMRIIPSRLFTKGKLPTKTASMILISLFTALLFTLPHLGNREISAASNIVAVILYYVLFGFAPTLISLQAGGFEPSIGIHAANNLYIALICNYTNSSLPSHSLILSHAPVGTFWDVLQLSLALLAVAYTLFLQRGTLSKQAQVKSPTK